MLTTHDIQALIELLQRTPMTKAEQLFAGRLIDTLTSLTDSPEEQAEANGDEDGPDHEPE